MIEKRPLVEGGPVTRTILHCHAGAGIDVPHQKGVVVQRDNCAMGGCKRGIAAAAWQLRIAAWTGDTRDTRMPAD